MQCSLGGRKAVRAALAAVLLAASAACSDSRADKASPTATVATDPPPTTTTNPYAVPAVIDIAYVNRVLAGLDAAIGDVLRIIMRANTIPTEAFDRLKALYADPDFLQIQFDNYQSDIRKKFASYKSPPGNQTTTVVRLITAKTTCIFAQVQRNYAAVSASGAPDPHALWVGLRPIDEAQDPNHYNPTLWAYTYDGFPPDRSQPPDPCAV